LGLDGRFARLLDLGFELSLRFIPAPLLELQQGHQLQGFDPVGAEVEQLPQFPLSGAAVVVVAMQFRQQQPQLPAFRLLVGELFQQSGGFLLLVQHQQQLHQPLLLGLAGCALGQALAQLIRLPFHSRLRTAGVGSSAVLPQPPATSQRTANHRDCTKAEQQPSGVGAGARRHGAARGRPSVWSHGKGWLHWRPGHGHHERPEGFSHDASAPHFTGHRTDAVPGHRCGAGDLCARRP